MSKNFYGRSSNIQIEVSFKEASTALKVSAILCFAEAFLGFGFLAVGLIFELDRFNLIGALLICLVPIFMMNAIRFMVPAEQKRTFVYRLCRGLFPGLGIFFFVAILGAQFAVDLERYILRMVMLGLPLIFLVLGVCLLRRNAAERRAKRCRTAVKAVCTDVEEIRSRMTLLEDIVESRPFDDCNNASFFVPTFRYEYKGREYIKKMETGVGNLNTDFAAGKTVTLYIDPDDPEKVLWTPAPQIFAVMGWLCILLAIVPMILAALLFF